tara:strand:+ start:46616 stop:46996 length:381 start_codon:yes stop_codon:yes gene_type:complete
MTDSEYKKYFNVDEKREEARLNVAASIYIETVSKEPGSSQDAQVVECECVDLSANGIQVLVPEPLKQGAIHTLIIDIEKDAKNYRLTAEVKWVKPYKSDFLTGLMLYDSEGTEIIDWKFMMSKFLN